MRTDFDALAQRAARRRRRATRIRSRTGRACGRAMPTARRSRSSSDPRCTAVGQSARCTPAAAGARQGCGAGPQRGARRCSRGACRTCCCSRRTCPGRWRSTSASLGLRLSDRSGEIIAVHARSARAAIITMIAFAKSEAPRSAPFELGRRPLSTTSGSVPSSMKAKGYTPRVGRGPARAGLELFLLRAGPVGSWAEYCIRHRLCPCRRRAGWPPIIRRRTRSTVWGPTVPDDFVVNREQPRTA